MRSRKTLKRLNTDAIRNAYEDALADGAIGKAERIRAANPDIFAGFDSSESNDAMADLIDTAMARSRPFSIAAVLRHKEEN